MTFCLVAKTGSGSKIKNVCLQQVMEMLKRSQREIKVPQKLGVMAAISQKGAKAAAKPCTYQKSPES